MISKPIGWSLVLAALILAGATALRYALNAGMIDAEGARRITQAAFGLALAVYANFIPKQIGRHSASVRTTATAQSAMRFGGWALALGGLGYAGLWAFAPIGFADTASTIVLATATVLTLGYALRAYAACRAKPSLSQG